MLGKWVRSSVDGACDVAPFMRDPARAMLVKESPRSRRSKASCRWCGVSLGRRPCERREHSHESDSMPQFTSSSRKLSFVTLTRAEDHMTGLAWVFFYILLLACIPLSG